MSGVVVVIGYLLLIPSIFGVAISIFLFIASGSASSHTLASLRKETEATLQSKNVPLHIIQRVMSGESISDAEVASLTQEQREAIRSAEASIAGGTVGAVFAGAIAGAGIICFGVSSFVGGLLGWLLVMRKRVLQCNNCSAVVAAS